MNIFLIWRGFGLLVPVLPITVGLFYAMLRSVYHPPADIGDIAADMFAWGLVIGGMANIWLGRHLDKKQFLMPPLTGKKYTWFTHSFFFINIKICGFISLALGILFACMDTPRPNFPWSLNGKSIPAFTIVDRDKLPADGEIQFCLTAVVSESITKEGLTLVSQKIIETLPRHNLAVIFFYTDPKDVNLPYTVGKTWWGVNGDAFPPPGDYSHHSLEVELGRATKS